MSFEKGEVGLRWAFTCFGAPFIGCLTRWTRSGGPSSRSACNDSVLVSTTDSKSSSKILAQLAIRPDAKACASTRQASRHEQGGGSILGDAGAYDHLYGRAKLEREETLYWLIFCNLYCREECRIEPETEFVPWRATVSVDCNSSNYGRSRTAALLVLVLGH